MSKETNNNYVTPELLAELDEIVAQEVPQGFFDDFSGETILGLPSIEVEDIPEVEVTPVVKSVKELREDARRQSREERDAYRANSRHGNNPKLPKGFDDGQ